MNPGILIAGLGNGAFYGLIALSYFLFVRATNAVNFALGAFIMFAAMTSAVAQHSWGLPVPMAVIAAGFAAIAWVWICESVVMRPILARTSDEFGAIMAIVALMFVVEQLAGIVFTKRPVAAEPFVDGVLIFGNSLVEYRSLLAIVVAVVVFALVDHWLRRGRYGRMLRAVGDNEAAARVLGLPIRRIKVMAILVTGLVCGVAGVLFVSYAPVNYHSHISFAVFGFVAMVIGGMGSAWAPLAGGLILGVIEAMSNYLLGGGARDYVLLVLVLLIFAFRPQGMFHVGVRV